jgi:hypothetical protein
MLNFINKNRLRLLFAQGPKISENKFDVLKIFNHLQQFYNDVKIKSKFYDLKNL